MVDTTSVSEDKREFSATDRLCLIQTLNALPTAQFGEVVFALKPPPGNLPSSSASQSSQSTALLEWAESSIGPGLIVVQEMLSKVISSKSKTTEKPLAFVISGKISDSTAAELQAFVELLRKKTGDDSIDLAFFREGSIKAILTGSPEGLAKLQELFEAGELEQLDIPPVKAVVAVDSNSLDARKALLIKALRLREQLLSRGRGTLKRTLIHVLVLTLALALTRDRAVARALTLALTHDHTVTLDLSEADFSGANLRYINLASADIRSADLSGADLSGADLSAADLSGADLSAANFSGADLTGAKVTDTVFRKNIGLTEAAKNDLRRRGAVFIDPPSSDVPTQMLR